MKTIVVQSVSDSISLLVGNSYLRAGISDIKSAYTSQMAYYSMLAIIPVVPIYNYTTDRGLA